MMDLSLTQAQTTSKQDLVTYLVDKDHLNAAWLTCWVLQILQKEGLFGVFTFGGAFEIG